MQKQHQQTPGHSLPVESFIIRSNKNTTKAGIPMHRTDAAANALARDRADGAKAQAACLAPDVVLSVHLKRCFPLRRWDSTVHSSLAQLLLCTGMVWVDCGLCESWAHALCTNANTTSNQEACPGCVEVGLSTHCVAAKTPLCGPGRATHQGFVGGWSWQKSSFVGAWMGGVMPTPPWDAPHCWVTFCARVICLCWCASFRFCKTRPATKAPPQGSIRRGGGRGGGGGGGSAGPSLLLWSPYGPRRRRAENF